MYQTMYLSPYDSYYYDPYDFVEHHGIKGQKWGVRRFQNKDMSLTPAGRARYGGSSNSSSRGRSSSGSRSASSSNSRRRTAMKVGAAALGAAALAGTAYAVRKNGGVRNAALNAQWQAAKAGHRVMNSDRVVGARMGVQRQARAMGRTVSNSRAGQLAGRAGHAANQRVLNAQWQMSKAGHRVMNSDRVVGARMGIQRQGMAAKRRIGDAYGNATYRIKSNGAVNKARMAKNEAIGRIDNRMSIAKRNAKSNYSIARDTASIYGMKAGSKISGTAKNVKKNAGNAALNAQWQAAKAGHRVMNSDRVVGARMGIQRQGMAAKRKISDSARNSINGARQLGGTAKRTVKSAGESAALRGMYAKDKAYNAGSYAHNAKKSALRYGRNAAGKAYKTYDSAKIGAKGRLKRARTRAQIDAGARRKAASTVASRKPQSRATNQMYINTSFTKNVRPADPLRNRPLTDHQKKAYKQMDKNLKKKNYTLKL